jgi:hypothetical protein
VRGRSLKLRDRVPALFALWPSTTNFVYRQPMASVIGQPLS